MAQTPESQDKQVPCLGHSALDQVTAHVASLPLAVQDKLARFAVSTFGQQVANIGQLTASMASIVEQLRSVGTTSDELRDLLENFWLPILQDLRDSFSVVYACMRLEALRDPDRPPPLSDDASIEELSQLMLHQSPELRKLCACGLARCALASDSQRPAAASAMIEAVRAEKDADVLAWLLQALPNAVDDKDQLEPILRQFSEDPQRSLVRASARSSLARIRRSVTDGKPGCDTRSTATD